MHDVTQILQRIQAGDTLATDELLPVVYQELRRLAAREFEREQAGHTLQATALVHEAYVRLVDVDVQQRWDSRGHFFAAAAEAMRRILVESARRRRTLKRGGEASRVDLQTVDVAEPEPRDDLLAIDEALGRLEEADPQAAQLVKLRYFSGLTLAQSAEALGLAPRSADRLWAYAKAWLVRELRE